MKRIKLLLAVLLALGTCVPDKALAVVDACIVVPSSYTVKNKTVWLCKGTWINLAAKNCLGNTSALQENYSWINLDNTDLTENAPNFYTPDEGRWELTLINGADGSSDKDTITIKYYPTPADFSVNNNAPAVGACTYESINLSVNGTTSHYSNFKWFLESNPTPVGTGSSLVIPSTSIPAGSAFYIGTAQYDSLYSGGNFSCIIVDTILVYAKQTPQVFAGKDTAVCEGVAVKLVAEVKTMPDNTDIGPSGKPSFNFEWPSYRAFTAGGPVIYGGKGGDTLIASSTPGKKSYTVTARNIFGCQTSDIVDVTVNPKPVPISQPAYICPGGSTFLLTSITAAAPPFKFAWTPKATLNDSTLQAPKASPAVTTTYTVYVTAINTGCKGSGTKQVIVTDPLTAVLSFTDSTLCPSTAIDLNAMASGGTAPYTFAWDPQTDMSDPYSAQPRVTPTATRTYNVKVTDARACSTYAAVKIDLLSVNLGKEDTIGIIGTPITLDAWNPTQPGYIYSWKDTSGTVISTDSKIIVSDNNTYTITVSDPVSGCSVSDTKKISFVKEFILKVFVPSAFSPTMTDNEDAHLRVYGNLISEKNFVFQVYNQWGEVVYETYEFSEATHEGWNGRLKNEGQDLTNGVYTYVLRGEYFDGTTFQRTGTATLIR